MDMRHVLMSRFVVLGWVPSHSRLLQYGMERVLIAFLITKSSSNHIQYVRGLVGHFVLFVSFVLD